MKIPHPLGERDIRVGDRFTVDGARLEVRDIVRRRGTAAEDAVLRCRLLAGTSDEIGRQDEGGLYRLRATSVALILHLTREKEAPRERRHPH